MPLRYRLLSNIVQTPLFALVTAFFGSLSLLVSLFEQDGRRQHRIARAWAAATLKICGAPLTVIGGEHLAKYPVAVYAANHASYMDTPVIFSALPMQFRILARHDLWNLPFIGWHLRRSGQIPIDTENTRASLTSLSRGVKALKAGMPLFVFPEGGRCQDGQLADFMNGASYLALRGGVPIVPMALIGTYELLPIHTRHIYPGPVTVAVGEPILTEGYGSRDLEALTLRLKSEISALYRRYADAEAAPTGVPLPASDRPPAPHTIMAKNKTQDEP